MNLRTDINDRAYRVFTYQEVDRVPDVEFGYWPQTIRRWLKEGLPVKLTPAETEQMFCPKLDQFFGLESEGVWIGSRTMINPPFSEDIIERRPQSVVSRDANGVVAERFLNNQEESSIPHYLEFPVKAPVDWATLRERYRADDPVRQMPVADIERMRAANRGGQAVTLFFIGFYGQLRNWMGLENLSLAFYDEPAMVQAMVECWADLCVWQIEQLPADIRIDRVDWWEDMAGRNGPLVSPAQFAEFIQPAYRRVMTAARQRGCVLSMVDCDGNPHALIQHWLAEGVNIMFPIEVAAGSDAAAWRREFGKVLRLRGGIAKQPLVEGGAAIDRELERIRPLLEDGGYIPHLDHLVPPDISYKNYCEYLEKKRKLIGK